MRIPLASLVFFCFSGFVSAQNTYPQTSQAIAALENNVPVLMSKADIPGMSVGLIREGKVVWIKSFGVLKAGAGTPVTDKNVFQAASLSKCVFAYGVMKLVDQGKLNLDSPLNKYLGNDYGVNDPRINLITARKVLSHTSGFPNWRGDDHSDTLRIHFNPGEKWSYSGEGVVFLSRVVSKITGLSLEEFMQQTVLRPLGMTASSYLWQDNFDSLKAWKHDNLGKATGSDKPDGGHLAAAKKGGNAAASLTTNASDYAKFLVALLSGAGLKKATWQEMMKPQIRVNAKYPELAWGLGVGLETMPEDNYVWHWGDNGDAKAYFTVSLKDKNGIIWFANSAGGLSIAEEMIADGLGKSHPALAYLEYPPYNSPARLLLKAIVLRGADPALAAYREQWKADSKKKIREQDINDLGYSLAGMEKVPDAIAVFKMNTEDFPASWNVWDSYGELMQGTGDKARAIESYEKSLALNPANTNAVERLKKLKQ